MRDDGSTGVPDTELEARHDPMEFRFAIVGDRQGLERPGVFQEAIEKINALRPEFVMSVGDLVTGYVWEPEVDRVDATQLRARWDEFDRMTAAFDMPFFKVPGNNDINSEVALEVWRERNGEPHYTFVYRDVRFIVLNSDDPPAPADSVTGPGGIGREQMTWLRSIVAAEPVARWTLIFLHRPMWADETLRPAWDEVLATLGERPYTVFAGHLHDYRKSIVAGRNHYILATTGGASELRGARYGEFDHITWVTMTAGGPVLANVMLDGLWGDDPVSEQGGRVEEGGDGG